MTGPVIVQSMSGFCRVVSVMSGTSRPYMTRGVLVHTEIYHRTRQKTDQTRLNQGRKIRLIRAKKPAVGIKDIRLD